MAIVKWEPFRNMDSFFDDSVFPAFPRIGFDLAADVYKEDGKVFVKMSIPGVNIDDLEVTLDRDSLTISGSREEDQEVNEKEYCSKEIRRGSFSRTIQLPAEVDPSAAEATYEKGILKVEMPSIASEEEKAVKLEIKK